MERRINREGERMKKKLVPLIVIALIITVVVVLMNGLEEKATTQPGDEAIEFELKDIHGNTYKLSDFKGKTVVLNFFATWCQPCIEEAPELEKFGKEYDDAQLLIIARGESSKRIEKYISDTDSKLLYLLDTKEEVSNSYSVVGQPETFIINSEGIIVERFSGPTTMEHLIQLIEQNISS